MTGAAKGYIRIKRVYVEATASDGQRVLVDRIWPRGISKEHAALDLWLKDIAPSDDLRHWFGHEPARYEEFRARYTSELNANPAAVQQLCALADTGDVTLVYSAHDEAHNQAVVLAGYLAARGYRVGAGQSGG